MGWRDLCRKPLPFWAAFDCSRHAAGISQSKCRRAIERGKDLQWGAACASVRFNFVPLFGLGLGYVLVEGQPIVTGFGPPRVELYGTVSQAYRPITYGELVPTGASSVVNGDLQEGNALQFEYGARGKPFPYLNFDVGGFYFTFDD